MYTPLSFLLFLALLLTTESAPSVTTQPGLYDWSLPSWVSSTGNSGFFCEEADASVKIYVRSVDLAWKQLNPSEGVYSQTTKASNIQGMTMQPYNSQITGSDPFWLRIWASGTTWAPDWVQTKCGVSSIGTDYDGQKHLPIWNPCVWKALMDLWKQVFVTWGLAADPRLKFVYAPGAFTWCEYDYDMINSAASKYGLTWETYNTWYQQAMKDMVALMGPYSDKLVFTGEDYPWGPFQGKENLLARDSVLAGMGIRTGITEVFNNHLNEVPAYGISIQQNAHLAVNESWVLFDGKRIIGTENECFDACGFHVAAANLEYAVVMSNLKALQMRMNWLYVVPSDSYMKQYSSHYEYVRLSLGKRASNSPDAWAFLREWIDEYWSGSNAITWPKKPYLLNWERWLVQKDVSTDGMTQRGSVTYNKIVDPANSQSWEGRRTNVATGQNYIYLDLYEDWVGSSTANPSTTSFPVQIKVSYYDKYSSASYWSLQYNQVMTNLRQSVSVAYSGTNTWKTATFSVDDAAFNNGFASSTDFRLFNGGVQDLEVQFIRVIKLTTPQVSTGGSTSTSSSTTTTTTTTTTTRSSTGSTSRSSTGSTSRSSTGSTSRSSTGTTASSTAASSTTGTTGPTSAQTVASYPSSVKTTAGTMSNQPVSVLATIGNSGTSDNWNEYIEFEGAAKAKFVFKLPTTISPDSITGISVEVNFKGPTTRQQKWTWTLGTASGSWVTLGDQTGATEWAWSTLRFVGVPQAGKFSSYIVNSEVSIQLKANNAADSCNVDFLKLTVSY